jgi:hypothetical protein
MSKKATSTTKTATRTPAPKPKKAPKPALQITTTTSSKARPIATTLVAPTPYSFTTDGLVFDPHLMTQQHWLKAMNDLATVRRTWHTCMADAIAFGRSHYGDGTVAETLQQLELSIDDVRRSEFLATLPGSILHSPGLTSEQAYILSRELPDAPKEEHERWATIAIEHKLTATALARCIQAGKVLSQTELDTRSGKSSGGIITVQGIVQTFRLWLTNVGGVEGLKRFTPAQRAELATHLQPITTVIDALN